MVFITYRLLSNQAATRCVWFICKAVRQCCLQARWALAKSVSLWDTKSDKFKFTGEHFTLFCNWGVLPEVLWLLLFAKDDSAPPRSRAWFFCCALSHCRATPREFSRVCLGLGEICTEAFIGNPCQDNGFAPLALQGWQARRSFVV